MSERDVPHSDGAGVVTPPNRISIKVRAAVPGDASAWVRMREALWPEEGPPSHGREVEQFFAGSRRMPLESWRGK